MAAKAPWLGWTAIVLATALAAGCGPATRRRDRGGSSTGCIQDAQRCNGAVVEHCDSGDWLTTEDCAASGKTCQTSGTTASCQGGGSSRCQPNPCSGKTPLCNATTGACECGTNTCGTTEVCSTSTRQCVPKSSLCSPNPCSGETPQCNTSTGACQCTSTSCTGGKTCDTETRQCTGGSTTCNLYTQSCGTGQACYVTATGTACMAAGSGAVGSVCTQVNSCVKGAVCINDGAGNHCYKACNPAGANTCGAQVCEDLGEGVGVCIEGGGGTCDLYAQDCPSGQSCYFGSAGTSCMTTGSTGVGSPCTQVNACVEGAICIDSGSESLCFEACDPSGADTCGSGSCSELDTNVGICMGGGGTGGAGIGSTVAECNGTGYVATGGPGMTTLEYDMRAIAVYATDSVSGTGFKIFGYTRAQIQRRTLPLAGTTGERQVKLAISNSSGGLTAPAEYSGIIQLSVWDPTNSRWSQEATSDTAIVTVTDYGADQNAWSDGHYCAGIVAGHVEGLIMGTGAGTITFTFSAPILTASFPQ